MQKQLDTTPQPPLASLEAVRARKAEVKGKIDQSMATIRTTAQSLTSPRPKSATKVGTFMNLVDQGLAVYDGIMMGMKVARTVRRIFKRRR